MIANNQKLHKQTLMKKETGGSVRAWDAPIKLAQCGYEVQESTKTNASAALEAATKNMQANRTNMHGQPTESLHAQLRKAHAHARKARTPSVRRGRPTEAAPPRSSQQARTPESWSTPNHFASTH